MFMQAPGASVLSQIASGFLHLNRLKLNMAKNLVPWLP